MSYTHTLDTLSYLFKHRRKQVMTHSSLTVILTALLCTDGAQSTCETGECVKGSDLTATIQFENYTSDICEDLKTYVHCLSTELDGCVGESSELSLLQTLADTHYNIASSKCNYGANGICDISDCLFVADLSLGFTVKTCSQMERYISCLRTELSECGTRTIYGTLIDSELDSRQLDVEQHCGSSRSENFHLLPFIAIGFAFYSAL